MKMNILNDDCIPLGIDVEMYCCETLIVELKVRITFIICITGIVDYILYICRADN